MEPFRRRGRLLLGLLVVAAAARAAGAAVRRETLDVSGVERGFLVHEPSGYDGKARLPVVLMSISPASCRTGSPRRRSWPRRCPKARPRTAGPAVRCRSSSSSGRTGEPRSRRRLYAVEGGGHTWPGGRQYLPQRLIGRTSRDLDASEAAWEFFKRQPVSPAARGKPSR